MAVSREQREKRARQYLWALCAMVFVAACTATGTYAYPTTLEAIQREMVIVHDVSGDIAIVISILYLINHLARTWKMKKATVSRWTGISMVALWCVCALTGLYGHFWDLTDGSPLWLLHFVTSIAIIIGVTFHGLWAYRPRKRSA